MLPQINNASSFHERAKAMPALCFAKNFHTYEFQLLLIKEQSCMQERSLILAHNDQVKILKAYPTCAARTNCAIYLNEYELNEVCIEYNEETFDRFRISLGHIIGSSPYSGYTTIVPLDAGPSDWRLHEFMLGMRARFPDDIHEFGFELSLYTRSDWLAANDVIIAAAGDSIRAHRLAA